MSFVKEFKEFAIKGNVMDMEVGVIIGGAFFSTQILYDDRVAPTLTSSGESIYWHEKRNINDTEYRRISTFPSDFDFGDAKVRHVCGMSVPPLMTAKIAEQIKLQWFESNNKLNAS